jgi:hypothetical protein
MGERNHFGAEVHGDRQPLQVVGTKSVMCVPLRTGAALSRCQVQNLCASHSQQDTCLGIMRLKIKV